jgi:hypothetical protein
MYKQDTALEYGTLKAYIMKRFSHSPSERAQRFLSLAGQPLGDSTVEEAWSEIEAPAKLPTKDGEPPKRISLKREILLQRLPTDVRCQIPDADIMCMSELVNMADKLLQARKDSSTEHSFNVDVEAYAVLRHRKTASRPSHVSQAQSGDKSTKGKLCFYHFRFGEVHSGMSSLDKQTIPRAADDGGPRLLFLHQRRIQGIYAEGRDIWRKLSR